MVASTPIEGDRLVQSPSTRPRGSFSHAQTHTHTQTHTNTNTECRAKAWSWNPSHSHPDGEIAAGGTPRNPGQTCDHRYRKVELQVKRLRKKKAMLGKPGGVPDRLRLFDLTETLLYFWFCKLGGILKIISPAGRRTGLHDALLRPPLWGGKWTSLGRALTVR